MNKINDEKLHGDFPDLFRGLYGKGVYLELGDGWFDLIYGLSKIIAAVDPDCVAVQIKEKFGGLRFYVGATSERVHDLIHICEHLSFSVCEECGSTKGVTTEGSWAKTLCAECRERKDDKANCDN